MRFNEIDASDIQSRRDSMLRDPLSPRFHVIYRAVPSTVNTFKEMDFVTMSRKFAEGHAESMAWTEEESYHVIKKMVDNTREPVLFNAPNEGEQFYNGPEVEGKEIYVAKEWAEFNK